MAEDSRRERERDMVLAPNEFMFVRDDTKGHVDVFLGPSKQSISGTDQPVVFDESPQAKKFVEVSAEQARQLVKTAPEGYYIVLKNPARNGPPTGSGKVGSQTLDIGKKVNIPGPVSFALWPGQMAKVLKGHHIRSNQYLIVRVYDEEEARKNWKMAVMKPAPVGQGDDHDQDRDGDDEPAAPAAGLPAANLTMGQLLVIKGTDVSFYMPPTGIEVVRDENEELVREAVTLERLEYCLLMDERGNKRYERGPAVVFPEPTEVFVEQVEGERKSKAIELNENSGIYIKVIADYEETGVEYKVGEELFITGRQQMIYFPREEHAIVKYDAGEVNHGVAIPSGEGRYVLDRNAGVVSLKTGPVIFLPDPRTQVLVRRFLDFKICNLLYPGNTAALEHNASVIGVDLETYMSRTGSSVAAASAPIAVAGPAAAGMFASNALMLSESLVGSSASSRGLQSKASSGFSGSAFERKTKYDGPRTITLPTKYEGAVAISIYSGYAMMLVRSQGQRRVVQGPRTVLLEYDETPEVMSLSTGKPKTTDNMFSTVYLRVMANKVSDVINLETKDFCNVEVKLSYRMNFEGDPENWFSVENYVKFLCDHARSRLKSAARRFGVEEFYGNSTEIIRDVILGVAETEDGDSGRSGMKFRENGMHVYDVEVLAVNLKDTKIAELLNNSQKDVIQSALALAAQRRSLEVSEQSEEVKRRMAEVVAETESKKLEIQASTAKIKLVTELAIIGANAEAEEARLKSQLDSEAAKNLIADSARQRDIADADMRVGIQSRQQQLALEMLRAEVQALVDRAGAITPDLISALDTFGERMVTERMLTSMSPLAMIGGESVTDVVKKLFANTSLAKHFSNGTAGAAGTKALPEAPAARS